MLIDTHCHIFHEYYEDVGDIINKMNKGIIIISGDNPKSNIEVIKLCEQYPNVYGTIGYHPEFATSITEQDMEVLEQQLAHDKIVGIGEIGLDYHYGKDTKEKQCMLFKSQILLARKYNLPIVIHSRDAAQDTYEILKDNLCQNPAIMHCYSYGLDMAKKFQMLGIKFGVGGTLTFKNNKKTVEVVQELDLTNFVLETDSPYLTPEPYRGKKNQPCYVSFVAQKIAEIKKISYEEVVEATMKTAISQFDLPI